jgi:hypothetical protein
MQMQTSYILNACTLTRISISQINPEIFLLFVSEHLPNVDV